MTDSPATYWVLQVDPHTGITLAADGSHAVNGNEHYRPFDTRADAETFCETQLRAHPDTEWCVFAGPDRSQAIKVYRNHTYLSAHAVDRAARVSLRARLRTWLKR